MILQCDNSLLTLDTKALNVSSFIFGVHVLFGLNFDIPWGNLLASIFEGLAISLSLKNRWSAIRLRN